MGKKNSQNSKFYAIALVLALAGSFMITCGFSELMHNIVINFSGQISGNNVTAESGYWLDIQKAVDLVAAVGGGKVYIPEGTFDFVVSSDGIKRNSRVLVPAGVSIFGQPTLKDANGQVVDWRTILRVPYEASNLSPNNQDGTNFSFFTFSGSGSSNESSRLSDIKFVGYREIDNASPTWYSAATIYNCVDWRVDHCFFKHITADALFISAPPNGAFRGVVDHCKFINEFGYVTWQIMECSVGYGISINPYSTTNWEPDITKVLGKYNNNTVYVEDCYFSRYRHNICSNSGAHFVSRHNTFEKDSCVGTLDGHGTYDYVGTRAMEIYDNIIIDPIVNWAPDYASTTPANAQEGYGVNWRGGGGVMFNNLIRNYKIGVQFVDEGPVAKCHPQNVYIWDNTWNNVAYVISVNGDVVENRDFFQRAPTQSQDGFVYTPYPYPHPLTLIAP